MAFVFLMTLRTLLPIECAPIHARGLEHPYVAIQVINNLHGQHSMIVTCFEGDMMLNGPMDLAHHESFMFSCPRPTIMGVSCKCKITSEVWVEGKEFSAFKYKRDQPFCAEDKCRWLVFNGGIALVDPFEPVKPIMEPIKFYDWDDAM
ncbi:hypothetical protein QQ045_007886 [Rhodiola kirilowii]